MFGTNTFAFQGAALEQELTDVIDTELGSKFVYPLYLHEGQILHATLLPPENKDIDYDLYLYEFDMTTGELLSNPIDVSNYRTYINPQTGATCPEGVCATNKTKEDKAYALRVFARTGYSATEKFRLQIALDQMRYDSGEPNQNAFKAFIFGEMSLSTGFVQINGGNINSNYDMDWYVLKVDNTGLDKVEVTVTNDFNVEVYEASDNKMVLRKPWYSDTLAAASGYYYICVYNDHYATDSSYTLTASPLVIQSSKPGQTIVYNSDEGTDSYPYYRETGNKFFRYKADWIEVHIQLTDIYGRPRPEKGVHFEAVWESPPWENADKSPRREHGWTDENGAVVIRIADLPPTLGRDVLNANTTGYYPSWHYVDLETITIYKEGEPVAVQGLIHFAMAQQIKAGKEPDISELKGTLNLNRMHMSIQDLIYSPKALRTAGIVMDNLDENGKYYRDSFSINYYEFSKAGLCKSFLQTYCNEKMSKEAGIATMDIFTRWLKDRIRSYNKLALDAKKEIEE